MVLARALVIEPRLLLMDEPLSNLDAKLRVQIRSLIRAVQRKLQITTIYVTHDQEEALAISDTIAVMDRGRVLQVGKPWELYLTPGSRFVADFIGTMNVFHGQLEAPGRGRRVAADGDVFGNGGRCGRRARRGASSRIGVRPESLTLERGANADDAWNPLTGTVVEAAYLGAVVRYQVRVAEGLTVIADIHNPDFAAIRAVGDPADALVRRGESAVLLPDQSGWSVTCAGRRRDLWWTMTVAGFLTVSAFLVYPLATVLVTASAARGSASSWPPTTNGSSRTATTTPASSTVCT